MLRLPKNLYSFSAGALALHVLDQVRNTADRELVSRLLVGAALNLTAATRWSRIRPDLELAESSDGLWTFGEATYAFFTTVDDQAIESCLALVMCSINLQVIVPSGRDIPLRLALDASIGRLRPVVFSLGDFLNTRVSAAVVDGGLTYHSVVAQVMETYNSHLMMERQDEDLLIELPCKAVGSTH